jgi:hypothetical protein
LTGPTSLVPGQAARFTLDIVTGASTRRAGFDVAVSAGTLAPLPQPNESWINSGELTHTKNWPKGATVQLGFTVTAPTSPGSFRIFATALSSDGVDDPSGDGASAVFSDVAVPAPADADLGVVDLNATPADLDVISSATEVKSMPAPDLGPPKDEPRWACACDLGRARSGSGFPLAFPFAFVVLVGVGVRRSRSG